VDLILPLLTTLYEIFMRPILREILKEREREREGGGGRRVETEGKCGELARSRRLALLDSDRKQERF